MDAIKYVHEQLTPKSDFPKFRAGDNIIVKYKIVESNKEREQAFRGDDPKSWRRCYQNLHHPKNVEWRRRRADLSFATPTIVSIEVTKRGKVRQSRIFYLRSLVGKKARIKERKFVATK